MDLRNLIAEIQRRRVGRVAGVYAVAGWVLMQVADTVLSMWGAPEWLPRAIIIAVLLGFPVAVVLAWVYDLTASGIKRTPDLPPDAVARPVSYARSVGFFGVGILVALVAFAAFSTVRERNEAAAAGVRSIAVLPFADMSQKHDQEFIADGISEEIRNRLAQLPGLKVSARTASFVYKGQNVSLTEIGRNLEVEAVLEGSVRREGNQIRITAQLVDARTMKNLWTQRYDRELSSVFALQDEIAADIVSAIKLKLTGGEEKVAQRGVSGSSDAAASEAYLQALHYFNRRTDADLRKAAELLESAVARDDQFAAAYAILAQTYALLPTVGDYPVFDAVAKGQAAAARAVGLNTSEAEAYSALGQIRQNFEWDFESADRHYRNAIRFNNGYATAHQWRAEALLLLGDYEGSRKEIDIALDLDPASAPAQHVKAYQHITRREYAAANRILDRLLAAHPEYAPALLSKGSIALLEGETAVAETILLRFAGTAAPVRAALTAVVRASADPAQRTAAVDALAALEGSRSASELALWYALIGENEKALDQIERAYESGADARLPFLLLHPAFAGIRNRGNYQKILADLHMIAELRG